MTYRGRVQNGRVLLDEPAAIPDGAVVDVRVIGSIMEPEREQPAPGVRATSIEEKLAAIWAEVPASEWAKLPDDLTDHLDHYVYGTPKK
jgi:hypothetical protein